MLTKLSLRNAKRSFRDYLVYIITMGFIAALMLAFNSMMFSKDIMKICSMAAVMIIMLTFASVFILYIVAWMTKYMIRFMMEQRSREFGTYLILGIPKDTVVKLFLKENAFLGALAFAIGILPSILISQMLGRIFYHLFSGEYVIHFSLSIPSLLLSAAFMILIYLISLRKIKKQISKMTIRDFMDLSKKNEQGKKKIKKIDSIYTVGSIGYLIFFNVLLFQGGITIQNSIFLLAGVIVAIYLFYYGLSALVIQRIERQGKRILHKSNLFIGRQLSSKILTMRTTMGTLTVLFTVALFGCTIAMMFMDYQKNAMSDEIPFDVCIFSDDIDETFKPQIDLINQKAKVQDTYIYHIYTDRNSIHNEMLYDSVPILKGSLKEEKERKTDNADTYFDYDTYMKLSDYNYLRNMLGYSTVTLAENEYYVQCEEKSLPYVKECFDKTGDRINGKEYVRKGYMTEPFAQNGHNGADYVIVVCDNTITQMEPYYSLMVMDLEGNAPNGLIDELDKLHSYINDEGEMNAKIVWGRGCDAIITCTEPTVVKSNMTSQGIFIITAISFPMMYIALVFVCVALTIMAVQQVSDASKYKFRYDVLSKLGLKEKEIDRIILKQLLLFYFCPFIGAVGVSSISAFYLSHQFIKYTGVNGASTNYYLIAVSLFAVLYIIYFVMTYIQFRRMVHLKESMS